MDRAAGWFGRSGRWMLALALLASTGIALGAAPAASAAPAVAARGGLEGVACVSATDCWATGFDRVGPPYGGVVLHWDGRTWAYVGVPYPKGSRDSSLTAITCFDAHSCLAAGHYGDDTTESSSYFDRWDGAGWRLERAPQPAGFSAGTTSCTTVTHCTALAVRDRVAAAVETWNGRAWRLGAVLPVDAGASAPRFEGLACVSATACTAVGSEQGATGSRRAVIDRLRGSTWSVVASPAVAGASGAQLDAVACARATTCQAVGGRSVGTAAGGPGLLERSNGGRWAVSRTPARRQAARFEYAGVSCRTASSCRAWGRSAGPAEFSSWNGRHWTDDRQAGGVAQLVVAAVSCASATSCFAVGATSARSGRLAAAVFDGRSWTPVALPAGS